ncbi:MAG: glycosyltransferase [Bacteroidota bacterium]
MKEEGALFIMPRSSKAWKGAEALWVTVAGWSSAAERIIGKAYVLTTDRIAVPLEVIDYPLGTGTIKQQSKFKRYTKWMPLTLLNLLKDILLWYHAYKHNNYSYDLPLEKENIKFIWEQHDLFSGPGRKLANELKVPLITYVHAPVVWEARKWGVKRPIWGWFLELFGEAQSLKKADVVACVSEQVRNKVIKMGVSKEKVIVSAMSVDPNLFSNRSKQQALVARYSLKDKTVVGWTGSFRSFHGLEILLNAFEMAYKDDKNLALMLVGDGSERGALENIVREKGLEKTVIFTGRKKFSNIPDYINLFDIAIVSARSASDFHYSPLKLREYLIAKKSTIAPSAGEIISNFKHNKHLRFYEAGNQDSLKSAIVDLASNSKLREELGNEGFKLVNEKGTWDYELKKVLQHYEKI